MEKILKVMIVLILIVTTVSWLSFKETKIVPIFNRSEPVSAITPVTGKRETMLNVPAVDNEGNGIVTILKVEAQDGEGRVLTDINSLLFWVDTQYSIRTAQRVAQNFTHINISNVDLIYTIETNASLIEGPSAGAAMTIVTIAALENRTLNESVMITGTINPDGTIGPVGEVMTKAKAAKNAGAELFLVPSGQGKYSITKPVEKCSRIGFLTTCNIEYKTEKVDITEGAGIEVREVDNIEEAFKYFAV